jgi:molybdopterin-biosynthesis enzyme MoeA-like protein
MSQNWGQMMSVEVGVLFSVISIVLGILGYQLNKTNQEIRRQQIESEKQSREKNEVKTDATREAVIETKLDNISNGVDNIRIDLRANERQIGEVREWVTRVDESAKQAHKRIDKIEGDSND